MSALTWARSLYIVGIAFALLFFLPGGTLPIIAVKTAGAALSFLLSAGLFALAQWRTGESLPLAALGVVLLPLSYLLSYAFSANPSVALLGSVVEADTLAIISMGAAAAVLGAGLFRTQASGRMLVRALMGILVLCALFQIAVFAGLFDDKATNLVGKWNEFGLTMVALAFLSLVELRFVTGAARLALGALALVCVVFLAMVNFTVMWVLFAIMAAAVAVTHWVAVRRVPVFALICALLAVGGIFFGPAINAKLTSLITLSSVEIRPSFQSTFAVTSATHGNSVKAALVGTGPGTFGQSWVAHKPADVNSTQFWALDFAVGYSTVATAFLSTGIVGVVAWLIPLVLLLWGMWRMRGMGDRTALTLGGVAALWWATLFIYVVSPAVLLAGCALVGAALGLLYRGALPSVVVRATAVVLILVIFATGALVARRAWALNLVGQGSAALQQGNVDLALVQAQRSQSIEPTGDGLRLRVEASIQKLAAIAAKADTSDEAIFTELLKDTIRTGDEAVSINPQDYRSYLSVARIFDFLAANKVQGAYDRSHAEYVRARELAPLNPAIPLMMARLEAAAGTAEMMSENLNAALALKPDYTDAILFSAQAHIVQNDLASAIRDTQAAVRTAPTVPSIWLQLGLLYYVGQDYDNASVALAQAIVVRPDYANAQYFLGLSRMMLGDIPNALSLFETLAKTNADNTEVNTIVGYLKEGAESAGVKKMTANIKAGRLPLADAPSR